MLLLLTTILPEKSKVKPKNQTFEVSDYVNKKIKIFTSNSVRKTNTGANVRKKR
jgi:hypothetical protein